MLTAIGVCASAIVSGYIVGLLAYTSGFGALPFLLLTVPMVSIVLIWLPVSFWLRTLTANCFGVGEVAGLMTAALQWRAEHGMGDKPAEILIPGIIILLTVLFWVNIICLSLHIWRGKGKQGFSDQRGVSK